MISTNVAVVVPLHKAFNKLSENEKFSLKSSCNKLSQYPHILFGPKELNWKEYQNFYADANIQVEIKLFKAKYFENIEGYNSLLKSLVFFRNFNKYDYILIFQTDAYILKDELEFWCKKGYDYIGAPWFNGGDGYAEEKMIVGVGNGGFSLRKIRSAIKLSKRIRYLNLIMKFWRLSHLKNIFPFFNFIKFFIKDFKIVKFDNIHKLSVHVVVNEDYYWSQIVANIFSDYIVSNVDDAIKFSFEENPSLLFKINGGQLPFGCHGWEKYEPNFWAKYILYKHSIIS